MLNVALRALRLSLQLIKTVSFVSVVYVQVACSPIERPWVDNKAPEDPGAPVYGGKIKLAYIGETNSWLPGKGNFAAAGLNVAAAIYDAFLMRDSEWQIRPYLAQSIIPNEDHSVWRMTLRPNVRFHDGTALDAAAVKWNFDTLHKAPGTVTFGAVRDVDSVEIIDALTVDYHLTKSIVAFPDLLIGPVGWPFSPTAAARMGDDAGSYPVGTGPFRFGQWRRDDRIELQRNEDYWQAGLPYLDELEFRPLPDEETRLASLISRDVDAIQTMRQTTVDRIRQTVGIHRYEFIGNNGSGSIFNALQPPVDDVRVRRALAYALPQDAVIEVLGGAGITPAQNQYFNPPSIWFSPLVAQRYPQSNQDEARRLRNAYVNDRNRSDGKSPGDPVAIEFLCLPDPSLMEVAQVYQAFWRAVGFEVRLRQVEQASHIVRVSRDDFMITCWRSGGEADPYITLFNAFGPPAEQPLNFTNFTHPEIDAALEILRTETQFDARYAAVERIMMVLVEEMPQLWNAASSSVIAVRPEVRNVAGWRFPDGSAGDGIPQARVMWGHVWRADS